VGTSGHENWRPQHTSENKVIESSEKASPFDFHQSMQTKGSGA